MAVPKLRFKEFDGDWGFKKIADISECIVPGRNKPKLFDGDIPWVTTPDLKDKTYVSDTRSNYYISEEEAKTVGSKIVPANSVIMSCVGDLGLFAINTTPIVINQQLHAFILDDHKYSSLFILNALSKNQDYIEKVATKTALPYLNKDNCNSIPLFLCSFKEQIKIASFLSSVDEKISQLTQKHELLSQYKQGMMQKLFSQQIRFKADDGSEFREWEEKTLKDFIINHVGGASLTPNDFVSESEYEVIPKKAITFNGRLRLDENSPTYCTKLFFEENFKNTVNKDYLITVLRDLVPSGPSIGYIVQFQSSKTYILAQGVYGFQITSNLNKAFLIHFSNTKQYRLVMKSIMVGSTQVHIRNQDFFGIQIPVPCQEEQTKIANFLSSIDQKIVVVAQQIEQAKQWKKGLLQQMFV